MAARPFALASSRLFRRRLAGRSWLHDAPRFTWTNAPKGQRRRPYFVVETMPRIHLMQQWFMLSDPAMEEALHDVPPFRKSQT